MINISKRYRVKFIIYVPILPTSICKIYVVDVSDNKTVYYEVNVLVDQHPLSTYISSIEVVGNSKIKTIIELFEDMKIKLIK